MTLFNFFQRKNQKKDTDSAPPVVASDTTSTKDENEPGDSLDVSSGAEASVGDGGSAGGGE